MPDGAVAWSRAGLAISNVRSNLSSLESLGAMGARIAGMALKSLWLKAPAFPKGAFRGLLSWSEKQLSGGASAPVGMSALSRHLLAHLDLDGIVRARRGNYLHLARALEGRGAFKPLFSGLPEGVCPLGLPVLCADRDKARRILIAEGVYPPVHWPLPPSVSESRFPGEHFLSRHILTLPIDQRYGERDMERMAAVLRRIPMEDFAWPR